jgi:CoA:oxalate CoA-transferase
MDAAEKVPPQNKSAGPLAGLRVLDLTQFLSGPFGTMILADMGAEVIKVEPRNGELSRAIPPHFVGEDSAYYLSVNRNKKNVAADLKSAEGVRVVKELALASDIVVENFRPGVLERLGISYADLSQSKPSLVWCSISGFGQDGPCRDWPAYDMVVQALSGGMSLTGEPEGPSVRAGIPLADLSAGMFGVIGILAALQERNKTGRGRMVDIAMLDCQVAMLSYQAAYYLHSGQVPGRQGSAHESFPTYRTFVAGDGLSIVVTANTEKMWQQMAVLLGVAELIDDPRFLTNRERLASRDELLPLLEKAFLAKPAQVWMDAFVAAGIPAGVLNTLDLTLSSPQVHHRGMVLNLQNDVGQSIRVVGNPVKFESGDATPHQYPPRLGQDTESVLRNVLGLSHTEIDALLAQGAVFQAAEPQT